MLAAAAEEILIVEPEITAKSAPQTRVRREISTAFSLVVSEEVIAPIFPYS